MCTLARLIKLDPANNSVDECQKSGVVYGWISKTAGSDLSTIPYPHPALIATLNSIQYFQLLLLEN